MGVRQLINEKPALAASIAVAVCIAAFALIGWQILGAKSQGDAAYTDKIFFSDDDGRTWFLDDDSKIAPFDHNGRMAYIAAVFRCGAGKPFVAYLAKYSDQQVALIERMKKSAASHPSNQRMPIILPSSPNDAKKPGDSAWVSATLPDGRNNMAAYEAVRRPICPDGSRDVTEVRPSDYDALAQ